METKAANWELRLAHPSLLIAIVVILLGVFTWPPHARAFGIVLRVDKESLEVKEGSDAVTFTYTVTNDTDQVSVLIGTDPDHDFSPMLVAGGDPTDFIVVPKPDVDFVLSAHESKTYTRTMTVAAPIDLGNSPDATWTFSDEVFGSNPHGFQGDSNIVTVTVKVDDVPELSPGAMASALTLLVGGVLTLTGRRLRNTSPAT